MRFQGLGVFSVPTIVGDSQDIRRISQQRYSQLYSLQLAMDADGSFAKLPENVSDVYQQRLPVSRVAPQAGVYQTLPSAVPANRTATVTTPVAIEPVVQRQSVALPQQEVSKTKNTVTTTTIRATP